MNKKIILLATLSLIFLLRAQTVHASVLDDFVNGLKNTVQGGVDGVKNLFTQEEDKNVKNKEFTIESDMSLDPGGDVNKNNEIDAGDIVRFTYTLKNTTDKKYSFGTLKTNIDRKQFNFFHNVQGTTNLVDDDKTIEIANVGLNAGETVVISFDARTLYANDDKSISTEAEFLDADKKSVVKAMKQAKSVKKNMPDFIPGMTFEKK